MPQREIILKVLALFLACLVLSGCAHSRHDPQEDQREKWFMRQHIRYYQKFARACDAILRTHTLEPNTLMLVTVTNSVLPKIITDLHPVRLVLTTTTISLDFDKGWDAFWLGWGQDLTHTNLWSLEANVQGSRRTVYSEQR